MERSKYQDLPIDKAFERLVEGSFYYITVIYKQNGAYGGKVLFPDDLKTADHKNSNLPDNSVAESVFLTYVSASCEAGLELAEEFRRNWPPDGEGKFTQRVKILNEKLCKLEGMGNSEPTIIQIRLPENNKSINANDLLNKMLGEVK
ncbi:MAG TPA: hypothetical protein VI819_00040 [Patescibacteria group bacterium]|nr:hypothetical protein [Patescibacteria group bacterium]